MMQRAIKCDSPAIGRIRKWTGKTRYKSETYCHCRYHANKLPFGIYRLEAMLLAALSLGEAS